MAKGLTITKQVHFRQGRGTGKALKESTASTQEPLGRVPRLSPLMVLAIRMQELVDAGEVADYAELAQLAQVSRPRITQIMSLLHLAPDIQQEILFLSRTDGSRAPIREHMVPPIAAAIDWRKQRRKWDELKSAIRREAQS
jgi:hypothetical protein